MTMVSLSAHSLANCPACPCAVALIAIARQATTASAGSTRRSENLAQATVLTAIDPISCTNSIVGSHEAAPGEGARPLRRLKCGSPRPPPELLVQRKQLSI